MTKKILILSRPKNRLEIQDEDDEFSYMLLYGVTHVSEGENEGEYEIFNSKSRYGYYKGIIVDVKEVREEWE
jgi:hypothetical protein